MTLHQANQRAGQCLISPYTQELHLLSSLATSLRAIEMVIHVCFVGL